jgi:hypothetical protein
MKARFESPCGLRLSIAACLTGALAIGLCGCGKKEAASTEASPPAALPSIQAPASSDAWVAMETLAAGKWTAIEGAANIEWNQESSILRIGATKELNGLRWTGPFRSHPTSLN